MIDPDELLAGFRAPTDFLPPAAFDRARDLLAGFREVLPPEHVDEVGAFVDHLERLLDARLRMVVARRVGLPYSEVTERWSHADLIAELAWDMMESADRWDRCPGCGTKNDEVVDDVGRIRDDSLWKLYLDSCTTCGEMDRAQRELAKVRVVPGTSWRLKPRQAGEPWLDDGGILADAERLADGSGSDDED